ncbi:hypothetical protein EDB89DRAFT_2079835 [Lactarius sanguifluus]|nr:hypothetical protein EDB89DRAFT_2079835 [Lactarius sanguifluus]
MTNPRPSKGSSRLSPKCARVGSPEEDHVEPDKDDPDDHNIGGPAISNTYDTEIPREVDSRVPPSPPPPIRSVRSGHVVRIPHRLIDYVPHGDMSLAHVPPQAPTPPERDDRTSSPTLAATPPPDTRPHPFQTQPNKLGVFRRYTHSPRWHPKDEERLDLVCDFPFSDTPPPPVTPETIHEISYNTPEPYTPFTSYSAAVFMAAYFSGSDTKSEEHANMVAAAMEDPRFLKPHPFRTQDGWHEATVNIRLPVEGRRFSSEDDAPTLTIPNLFHRRITDIIRSVCASEKAQSFHFLPYTMHWAPDPNNPDKIERVYGETYSSDAMIQAQLDVDSLPRPEGDTTERVALGLMLASDSSQLTNFGSALVWPVYLMFANQSKQEQVRPSCHAVHHLAYVPSIGANFASRYLEETGQAPSADITVHCKRELMHAIWNHLMDDAFVEGCT